MESITKIVVKKPRVTNKQLKKYQRMNLTNDFLFKHCFSHAKILRPLLEELWNKEIGDIVEISHDHRIQLNEEYRYAVCDIYVRDSKGDIYILEMQQRPHKELRKRSVCYQAISMFDHCTLKEKEKERIEYSSVSECYIAFLCCFDVSKVFRRNNCRVMEEVADTVYASESMLFIDLRKYERISNERLRELFKFILNSDIDLHAS